MGDYVADKYQVANIYELLEWKNSLQEKIIEVLPKNQKCPDANDFDNGWNACRQEVIDSLPLIFKMIGDRIEEMKKKDRLFQYTYDIRKKFPIKEEKGYNYCYKCYKRL